jgi:hypothetical protein
MTTATPEADIHFYIGPPGQPINETYQLYDPAHPPRPFANDTINAKAFRQYYIPSTQVNGRYFAEPRCATPTCTPDGGTYPSTDYNPTKTIAIGSVTGGCKLRYTINNTDVTNGTLINDTHGHVEVHADDVLRVIAQKAGHIDSLVKVATYSVEQDQTANPSLDPQNQTVFDQVHFIDVQVSCSTPNATASYVIQNVTETPIDPTRTVGTHINTLPATIRVDNLGHKVLRIMCFRQDLVDSDIIVGEYDHDTHR